MKITPAAWRSELVGAAPADYDRVLARVHLPPLGATSSQVVRLDRVDVFRANLSTATGLDVVVQAKFTINSPSYVPPPEADWTGGEPLDTVHACRIEVLSPLGGGAWCAVSSALSSDRAVESGDSCYDNPVRCAHEGPLTFGFTHLTDPDHVAIEVVQSGSATGRRSSSTTEERAFWVLQDEGLVRVLSVDQSYEYNDYVDPDRPYLRRWFTLSSTIPRDVHQFQQRCTAAGDCGAI